MEFFDMSGETLATVAKATLETFCAGVEENAGGIENAEKVSIEEGRSLQGEGEVKKALKAEVKLLKDIGKKALIDSEKALKDSALPSNNTHSNIYLEDVRKTETLRSHSRKCADILLSSYDFQRLSKKRKKNHIREVVKALRAGVVVGPKARSTGIMGVGMNMNMSNSYNTKHALLAYTAGRGVPLLERQRAYQMDLFYYPELEDERLEGGKKMLWGKGEKVWGMGVGKGVWEGHNEKSDEKFKKKISEEKRHNTTVNPKNPKKTNPKTTFQKPVEQIENTNSPYAWYFAPTNTRAIRSNVAMYSMKHELQRLQREEMSWMRRTYGTVFLWIFMT